MVLADDPASGVPGLTDDPAVALRLLSATLDTVRQVAGVGRVLLVHPPDAGVAASRPAPWASGSGPSWAPRPASATRGRSSRRSTWATRAASSSGSTCPTSAPARITEAVGLLEEHQGVVIGDGEGGIGLLAPGTAADVVRGRARAQLRRAVHRASQQLVRLVELPPHHAGSGTHDTLGEFAALAGLSRADPVVLDLQRPATSRRAREPVRRPPRAPTQWPRVVDEVSRRGAQTAKRSIGSSPCRSTVHASPTRRALAILAGRAEGEQHEVDVVGLEIGSESRQLACDPGAELAGRAPVDEQQLGGPSGRRDRRRGRRDRGARMRDVRSERKHFDLGGPFNRRKRDPGCRS